MQVTEEERAYLGLQFQRDESPPRWGWWGRWGSRQTSDKHCSGGRMGELTSPTTAQSRESKPEVGKTDSECKGVCLFVFVVFILQQGWSTYTSPNNAANWGSSIEMPKTMEDIPYSNHTAKVLAPSLISSVRSPEPRQENTEPCRLPSDLHCMPTYIHTHTHNCKTKL